MQTFIGYSNENKVTHTPIYKPLSMCKNSEVRMADWLIIMAITFNLVRAHDITRHAFPVTQGTWT